MTEIDPTDDTSETTKTDDATTAAQADGGDIDARTDGGTTADADPAPGVTEDARGGRFQVDPSRVVLYAVLLLVTAFYLTPLESGVVTSFKTNTAVTQTFPFAPPLGDGFTTDKWATAFDMLGRGLLNSALYAIPATLLSGFLGSIAAYGLTQATWKRRYKAIFLALFVAGVFIPYQAVLVPLTEFWTNVVNLNDLLGFLWSSGIPESYANLIELSLTHVAYGIPVCTVLFRSYYKNMSEEMIESARLDGATLRRVYRRIVLPLSTPMFAVVLIYQFTQIWNDLLFALILVSSATSEAAPATLVLAGLGVDLSGTNFGLQMAGALLTALPTIAVYVMFSEEFSEGVAT
ncbi:carbohydrate ABC transporter permease [Halorubellus sp. JP-L1]|uniref:carbohydrate ABC transporter permease n=1 Tax=Halorubellus sp. JP-L1 TaxID=2715753 RepID=UPI00140B2D92|nr:carbohydrate ABC transporter permease [Halorubellus sp. JP-L1]NHN40796.1 carbohydrate ABC transporter permease [Halorubellus sp. JP-L1]